MAEDTIKKNIKEVKASVKSLHISPRKVRLVTNVLKNMRVSDALTQLEFLNKRAALPVAKLLRSAVANAEHNFSLDPEKLFIKSIMCDMGKTMKRYFPRARGSAEIIRRKMSHINVVLEERSGGKSSASRLAILSKLKKEQKEPKAVNPEVTEAAPETREVKPEKRFKTEEQVKMNKVQQKRRLFNRKTGE